MWKFSAKIGLLAAVSMGCTESTENPSVAFVSVIPDSELAIAVARDASGDSTEAVVYVCDGVSVKRWYLGTMAQGVISAESEDGDTFEAEVSNGEASGTVMVPNMGMLDFTAPLVSQAAGLYLVEHAGTEARGLSIIGGEIEGTLTTDESGTTLSGTVTSEFGTSSEIDGTAEVIGGVADGPATWIVQADGSVKGAINAGDCTLWQKFWSSKYGVECSFIEN